MGILKAVRVIWNKASVREPDSEILGRTAYHGYVVPLTEAEMECSEAAIAASFRISAVPG